uniref:Uncharacterized protein n=1 Tax=Oryza nivara TaxID=4536 RepID=A0A0E0G8J4_ORYNI
MGEGANLHSTLVSHARGSLSTLEITRPPLRDATPRPRARVRDTCRRVARPCRRALLNAFSARLLHGSTGVYAQRWSGVHGLTGSISREPRGGREWRGCSGGWETTTPAAEYVPECGATREGGSRSRE